MQTGVVPIWCVCQHIIQIVVQMLALSEDSSHQSTKSSWCIHETERHHLKSEQTLMTDECGEVSVFLVNRNLPISLAEIKLGEESISSEFGKDLFCCRHRLRIKYGLAVQLQHPLRAKI